MRFEVDNLGYPLLKNIETEVCNCVIKFIESIIEIVDKNEQNKILNELKAKLKK